MLSVLQVLVLVCIFTGECVRCVEVTEREKENEIMMFGLGRTTPVVSNARHMRRYLTEEGPDAPLYRGFGTHFVYVYVGTPRQRVSVIVDTGSHHTAFPCTGCSQCGDHTDLYFNPKKSSSIVIPRCSQKNCVFSQSYTEGSMWTAYRVRDRFFIGGETVAMAEGAEKHDVEFTFGCQTKETGLFRTQMENGIMGLSADAKTLPNTLYKANITRTNAFALCFLPNGGVMSLGGSHPQLKQGPMQYAQMTKKSGYFTVKVLSMFMKKSSSSDLVELNVPLTKLNSGKGVIVDSGTTDTYLPSAISSAFQSLFKKLSGTSYTRSTIAISAEDLKKLPTVVFRLQKWHPDGKSREFIQVEMPPTRYLEQSTKKSGKELYVFRLYLTERSGGVLGANFMTGQNIEFDQKQQRIGFAPSHCKATSGDLLYQKMTKPVKLKKHLRRLNEEYRETRHATFENNYTLIKSDLTPFRATGPCNAKCDYELTGRESQIEHSYGYMPGVKGSSDSSGGKMPCTIACLGNSRQQVVLWTVGNTNGPEETTNGYCPLTSWGICGEDCTQTRQYNNRTELSASDTCRNLQTQSRECWRELCPFVPNRQCAYRLKLSLPLFKTKLFNNIWKEDIIDAIAQALQVNPSAVDIPQNFQKGLNSVETIVHVRVDKVKDGNHFICPKNSLVTHDFDVLLKEFVEFLHDSKSKICWDWVRRDNTHLMMESSGNDPTYASRLELRVRSQIIRRQERRKGNTIVSSEVMARHKPPTTLRKWADLVLHRENFWKALLYTIVLFIVAMSSLCCFRARQEEHRKKLESPKGDINGFKYYVPN